MSNEKIEGYLRSPLKPKLRYFPHSVAAELSDLAAVLLYDLHGRIRRQEKPLVRDGFVWTFDSMRVFVKEHPYASEAGIRKAFLELESAGYIGIEKSGKYNRKKYDEKWWYRLTDKGYAAAGRRRIRFSPMIASAVKIPSAVLLESLRYQFHDGDGQDDVLLDPEEQNLPYHPKTIQRHLNSLVASGCISEVSPKSHRYSLPENNWYQQKEPITVEPEKLLPKLSRGHVGLLVGHSGTGKTSLSTFIAVQRALAGSNVLYVTLEEPAASIVNRMYAQECGVSYSDLRRGSGNAQRAVQETLSTSPRAATLKRRLRVRDLSGERHQLHEIADAIEEERRTGFQPHLLIIDQLEFIDVEYDVFEGTTEDIIDAPLGSDLIGNALAPALVLKEALGGETHELWVLHQVNGACQAKFNASG